MLGVLTVSLLFANDVKLLTIIILVFGIEQEKLLRIFLHKVENVPSGLISANNNKEHHNGNDY